MEITIYSKNNCVQCTMTKRFLNEHGADFNEINLSDHPELIDELKQAGFAATPIIKTDTGVSFTGFRPDNLRQLLG